ncbi:hypothetical protein ACWE42_16535, partial [Sutcliffiella cohnii]
GRFLKIDLHAIVLFSFQRTFFNATLRSDFIILPNRKLKVNIFFDVYYFSMFVVFMFSNNEY